MTFTTVRLAAATVLAFGASL